MAILFIAIAGGIPLPVAIIQVI